MSEAFRLIHKIFNATPPIDKAPDPYSPACPGTTKVQAYLDRLAAEPQPATGVEKYLAQVERDDFNRRHQPSQPTGVERYLAAQGEAERPRPPAGPSGVQRYLDSLTSVPACHPNTKVQAYLDRLVAEPRPATGVEKYLVQVERDDFNRRHQPSRPTGVERYLAAQGEAERPRPPAGPSGVQRYLDALAVADEAA